MICPRCEKEIPSCSLFCMYCGKKLPKQKQVVRPKGSGCIYQRKNKYLAYLNKKYIGSADTYEDAELLISNYKNGTTLCNYSVEDIFKMYCDKKEKKWSLAVYKQNVQRFDNYFFSIRYMKITDVKAKHYQDIIDDASQMFSYDVCTKIRTLIRGICNEAMINDLIDKNYGDLLTLPPKTKSVPAMFTPAEISTLWAQKDIFFVKVILFLTYTGMRPNELFKARLSNVHLDEQYLITGSKTDAGKDRVIPIADRLVPLVQDIVNASKTTLLGGVCSQDNFTKKKFAQALIEAGIEVKDRTPYSCRHTFYTMCRNKSDIDKGILMKTMGHSTEEVGLENYYHPQIQEKIEMVNQLMD